MAFPLKLLIGLWLLSISTFEAQGEPWLGTRYAQNCSGCHAPGRRNLPPVERRCSLSCQGCHVNPNGGGLRNAYGKWNENRWLRTWKLPYQKKKPAPLQEQEYYRPLSYFSKEAKSAGRKPSELKETEEEAVPESRYDRYRDFYYDRLPEATREEFLFTVPVDDPYNDMFTNKLDAGLDIRFATLKRLRVKDDNLYNFVMSADMGLRWRPIFKNVHFVYEARVINGPVNASLDSSLKNEFTRSLYAMVDDLPYNVFVMGGFYRPNFGNMGADHYALAQVLTASTINEGKPYKLLFKAVSIGTAPNVPYANLHLIARDVSKDPGKDGTQGVVVNTGLRFVSFGASINYSLWYTKNGIELEDKTSILHSWHLLGTVGRFILGVELLSLTRDNATEDYRRGSVISYEAKFRFWRENYLTLDYAVANTAQDLSAGESKQLKLGLKSFLFPGWEYSLQWSLDNTLVQNRKQSQTTVLSMLHMYL